MKMDEWKRVALEKFPHLRELIEEDKTTTDLWIDLLWNLEDAYKEIPVNGKFIDAVYDYASWSLVESNDDDVQSSALIHFYENLPRFNEIARNDIPNRMSRENFLGMKEIYKYSLSEEEHAAFMKEMLEKYYERESS